MKNYLKRLAEGNVPAIFHAYRAVKFRMIFRRQFGLLQKQTREFLYPNKPIEVLSGPFRGLKYIDETVWGSITTKWLGSYEIELADAVEEIAAIGYQVVIDVGSAEGYYAVGLAYRMPSAHVFAYDIDFISRRQVRKLAQLNHLENQVTVGGFCTHAEVARRAQGRTLIVCDIEGSERIFLDPTLCPTMTRVDVLVEVHGDGQTPGMSETLKARFAATHSIQEYVAEDRHKWVDESIRSGLLPANWPQAQQAANETRGELQTWLWMKAN